LSCLAWVGERRGARADNHTADSPARLRLTLVFGWQIVEVSSTMNRQTIQEQLQGAVDTFTGRVFSVFGEALLAFVSEINAGLDELKPAGSGDRPRTRVQPAVSPFASASSRRTVDELEIVGKQVLKLLQQRGAGMRIEEINRTLGTNTRQLMRLIKMLLHAKKLKKTGQRRSTTYFAA
jgi:hypothetical protein